MCGFTLALVTCSCSLDLIKEAQVITSVERSSPEVPNQVVLHHMRLLTQVQTQLSNHVAAMLPAVVIGLVSGTLAIAFTAMNLKAARLREAVFTKDKRLKILEPLLIISVFVTLGMLLPLAFPCTPTSCVMREGEGQPFCPPGVTTHVK